MQDTIASRLNTMASVSDENALRPILNALADRFSSQALSSAGLVIKTGGSALAKTGSAAWYGVANGVPVSIAGSTDMPALTGINVSAGKYNVACFFIDSAGTVTALGGTEGATLAAVKFPESPVGKALVGFLIITYASAFTGGTTALDTATTVYVNPIGAFDPNIILS